MTGGEDAICNKHPASRRSSFARGSYLCSCKGKDSSLAAPRKLTVVNDRMGSTRGIGVQRKMISCRESRRGGSRPRRQAERLARGPAIKTTEKKWDLESTPPPLQGCGEGWGVEERGEDTRGARTCRTDAATAEGREASRSHAFDSPSPAEHKDV